jgi:hypothetical protein
MPRLIGPNRTQVFDFTFLASVSRIGWMPIHSFTSHNNAVFWGVSGELIRGPILPANRAAKGRCLSLFERTW